MHRDILISCIPCLVALIAAAIVLRGLLVFGSMSFDWRRLSQVHSCQQGGVQSLAFVLTMPVFVMVVLFIIQVSQLMVAQMVVQYAAFAGARSASVWLPAAVDEPLYNEAHDYAEVENRLRDAPMSSDGDYTTFEVTSSSVSEKLWKVRAAVLQALAPVAPSEDLGLQGQMRHINELISANQQMYSLLVPQSQSNSRIPARIANKLNYCDRNTRVIVEWRDGRDASGRDSIDNTAHNVRNHTCPHVEVQTNFRESEIGWQDPITVYVLHQFALMPGPGRFLAKRLVRADGLPDRVSPRINQPTDASGTRYTTQIATAVTLTCEGLKSVKPVVQPYYALPATSQGP